MAEMMVVYTMEFEKNLKGKPGAQSNVIYTAQTLLSPSQANTYAYV